MVHGQSPFGIPPPASPIDDPAPRDSDAGEEHIDTPVRATPPIEYVAPPPPRRSPRRRIWTVAVAGILGLIVVTSCVTGGWYLALDGAREEPQAASPPTQPADPAEVLQSRAVDDAPLTSAELFGAANALPEPAHQYRLFHEQELDDCDEATTAAMRDLLRQGQCSQIVRASVGDASGDYIATVGVVNLADAAAVDEVKRHIDDDHDGAFKALRPNGGSAVGASPTVLGYNALGHYLLYAVIARADGTAVSSKDDTAPRIVADLVDDYLVTRLEARAE